MASLFLDSNGYDWGCVPLWTESRFGRFTVNTTSNTTSWGADGFAEITSTQSLNYKADTSGPATADDAAMLANTRVFLPVREGQSVYMLSSVSAEVCVRFFEGSDVIESWEGKDKPRPARMLDDNGRPMPFPSPHPDGLTGEFVAMGATSAASTATVPAGGQWALLLPLVVGGGTAIGHVERNSAALTTDRMIVGNGTTMHAVFLEGGDDIRFIKATGSQDAVVVINYMAQTL